MANATSFRRDRRLDGEGFEKQFHTQCFLFVPCAVMCSLAAILGLFALTDAISLAVTAGFRGGYVWPRTWFEKHFDWIAVGFAALALLWLIIAEGATMIRTPLRPRGVFGSLNVVPWIVAPFLIWAILITMWWYSLGFFLDLTKDLAV